MAQKQLKPGTKVERALLVERAAINEESRTVELAFASETPYERWWGIEVLDLSQPAVRLGRLTSGGPLLMDHDTRDHIGVIESVQIGADRVGRAVVRFGKSARAEEIFQDVKDGIRRNVSVGYVIHKAQLVETSDSGTDTYRVTDWEPLEISLVSVPADATVGIGRSADAESPVEVIPTPTPVIHVERNMEHPTKTEEQIRAEARSTEQARVNEIIALGDQFKSHGGDKIAAECLRSGKSLEEARQAVLAHIASKPLPTADIGMSREEAKHFSFVRALNALANPADRKAQEAAGFEREASDAVASKMGRSAQGFFVPVEVQQRDLEVGTGNGSTAGKLVATNLLAGSFIDLLRNRMAIVGMGAQFLTGLVGQIAIPRATGGATAYWVAESGAPSESGQAFDQVTMTPKTVGAFTDLSRKLLLQSSVDVEGFVRKDLAKVLALEIDRTAVNGSGSSNQPTGILNVSGIGSVAGGTNGASITVDHLIDLETLVAIANADVGSLGYLTNAKVVGALKKLKSTTGEYLWTDSVNETRGGTPGSINGYGVTRSNQVPSNLTKGSASGICSSVIFGNFADLIIGQWGSLDLMVDPYTGSASGTVRVVALQDVDIAVRHAESFAAMKDALTS